MPHGIARGPFAPLPAPLLALTQDARFLATLRKISEPAHAVHATGSEIDLAAGLMAQEAGVAVLDSAAVATPIQQLAGRLHAQFPDLVLIVAGTAEEQGALAALITDGSVHRFLHKPVSEQRVRLFVEAAWRRHEETRSGQRAAAAAPTHPRRGRWGVIAAALIAVAAPLAWLLTRPPPTETPAPATPAAANTAAAAAANDAALEDLLARADKALAEGALVAPAAENAADLYREALRRNARDPRAVNGLEQVIDRLVTDAEAQLNDHHLDAAQQLADEARAINPSHPRVAFLTAQIGAQRERAVLGKAQRAAAGGDVSAALAVLDDATRGGHRSTLVDEARQQLAQKQIDERVADFVARGRDALGSGALLEPPEQNAHFFIESARALAPNDPAVQLARQDLIARLEGEARKAVAAGNAEQADTWANAAADDGAEAAEVGSLHASAQQLRGAAKATTLARMESLFNQRLAQGRVLEPASDSAKYYLEQLAQAEPAAASTLAARTAFETRLLDEAHGAVHSKDYAAARRWLSEAHSAGASPAGISAAEAELSAAQSAGAQASGAPGAVDATYLNESALTRTRYVAPQYPPSARDRGIAGWVDVQFLVNPDGSTSEVTIVGAQPVGIFEQAALDAVRHWRYQPVLHDGAAGTQRARVRVRFAVTS